jgi:LAS superfamily LD-carboxypeptidase LdcB
MLILSPKQLTGRVRSHVMELHEPRCTLQPDAARAFLGLRAEAAKAGIDLSPASTFRDFDRQLMIWNDKFSGRRPLLDVSGQTIDPATLNDETRVRSILIWSALPGASRHHWGTEVDVFDRAAMSPGQQPQLVPAEYAPGGVFERLAAWLPEHCERFGFFRPYDVDRGGVQPEAWHLSYAPVSRDALEHLTVRVLEQALVEVELAGAEVVMGQLAAIHEHYVAAVARPSQATLAAIAVNP